MSVKKSVSLNNGRATSGGSAKRRQVGRRFTFTELSIEPGKSLKRMDSEKLKAEIKRWAKAVVAYARQVSGRFSGSGGSN